MVEFIVFFSDRSLPQWQYVFLVGLSHLVLVDQKKTSPSSGDLTRWQKQWSIRGLKKSSKGGLLWTLYSSSRGLKWWFAKPYSAIFLKLYTTPGTQMTIVLIGKGLVLGGWPSKIEVIWVPGIYYIITSIYYTYYQSLGLCVQYGWVRAMPFISGNWVQSLKSF